MKSRLVVILMLICFAAVTSCAQQKSQQPALPAQPAAAPVPAQPLAAPAYAAPVQTQDTNTPGVVAELMECKRKEGVLTMFEVPDAMAEATEAFVASKPFAA